jgi:hypothetical protein
VSHKSPHKEGLVLSKRSTFRVTDLGTGGGTRKAGTGYPVATDHSHRTREELTGSYLLVEADNSMGFSKGQQAHGMEREEHYRADNSTMDDSG